MGQRDTSFRSLPPFFSICVFFLLNYSEQKQPLGKLCNFPSSVDTWPHSGRCPRFRTSSFTCLGTKSSFQQAAKMVRSWQTDSWSQREWNGRPKMCCCCAVLTSCLTLYDSMGLACQAPLSFTVFQSLLRFMSIELVILSNHLIFRWRLI